MLLTLDFKYDYAPSNNPRSQIQRKRQKEKLIEINHDLNNIDGEYLEDNEKFDFNEEENID